MDTRTFDSQKKMRDKSITKRFNSNDIKKWQAAANKEAGGNLTLWIELILNKEIGKYKNKI